MLIELSSQQEARIQKQLATGRFSDQGAVLDEALDLLERKNDMSSFRDALRANHERNKDLTVKESEELAEAAVRWARQAENR